MRATRLLCCVGLAILSMPGPVPAADPWVEVGDLHYPRQRLVGKVSVNLESMRHRNGHYEVWERIAFAADAPTPSAVEGSGAEGEAERMTLWAIRCRRGAMAKLTERVDGMYLPRNEALRFSFPSPASAGAALVETACAEARRRHAAIRREPEQGVPQLAPRDLLASRAALERPPPIPDEDLDADDE